MMPGITSIAVAFSQSGGGVVPDAVTWADIEGATAGETGSQTITGIGSTIQLRAELSSVTATHSAMGALYAVVDGAYLASVDISNGLTMDFDVSPDAGVDFSAAGSGGFAWTLSATAAVKYKSAGSSTFDQTLDSFDIALDSSTA